MKRSAGVGVHGVRIPKKSLKKWHRFRRDCFFGGSKSVRDDQLKRNLSKMIFEISNILRATCFGAEANLIFSDFFAALTMDSLPGGFHNFTMGTLSDIL